VRQEYHPHYYAAFIVDPAATVSKLCVMHPTFRPSCKNSSGRLDGRGKALHLLAEPSLASRR
jgi:hypothetical protein